jgi:hypothetical protein
MDLVDHWVVGFSGKRQLENPEAVRLTLRQVLQELRNLVEGELVAMSSAAIGGDLLFATEATKMGMPWICVLPFPEEAFFNERDFPEEAERNIARGKARQAADCEIVRLPRNVNELSDSTWRRAAFAEAGFRCVDEADIVITVFRDGDGRGKPGGTGDVLAYARAARRPLVVIDLETLQLQRENWPARLHDSLTQQLRRLPGGELWQRERENLPTPAAVKVGEWRSGFARAARKHVPGIRWATTFVVVFHAIATIITASVLLQPFGFISHNYDRALEVAACAFVSAGFAVLVWLLVTRPQRNAASYRLAAEVGRSILATWSIPWAGAEIVRSVPGEFMHFARNLLLHQRLDPDRQRELDHLSTDEINNMATQYVAGRIKPQIGYYHDKCATASRWARRLEIASLVLSATAVISAFVLALIVSEHSNKARWGFAKLAAATAAPVMVSLLVIHEAKRREARYDEMENSLRQFDKRMGHIRSLAALRDVVVDVEHMLLSESHEWWVLAKANVAA